MADATRVVRPAVWAFYVVIVFEILFMISPFALHFYAAYGPTLNFLHRSPMTAWLTKFYLPHFAETSSALLNAAHDAGFALIGVGLALFLGAAIPIYWAKLRAAGPVTGGLYAAVRHPQYLALAITGVGTGLVWPRFLVLITFVTMIFLYTLLADWEEQQCLARFGESYGDYHRRTGRFLPGALSRRLPRILPASGRARGVALAFLYALAIPLAVALGFALRDRSIARLAALFEEDTAVISTAYLDQDELRKPYGIALADARVRAALDQARGARFVVYVVPSEWLLPDLPLDTETTSGGHHVPADFDRTKYKVLFTRARLHGGAPAGADIVKAAYGRDPLIVGHVDVQAGTVARVSNPPAHVRWGDIPTPMF